MVCVILTATNTESLWLSEAWADSREGSRSWLNKKTSNQRAKDEAPTTWPWQFIILCINGKCWAGEKNKTGFRGAFVSASNRIGCTAYIKVIWEQKEMRLMQPSYRVSSGWNKAGFAVKCWDELCATFLSFSFSLLFNQNSCFNSFLSEKWANCSFLIMFKQKKSQEIHGKVLYQSNRSVSLTRPF